MPQVKEQALYHGIMDCHGLESLHEFDVQDGVFKQMRASSNPQRHAIYFTADLSEDEFEEVGEFVEKKDWEGACKYLKQCDCKYHGPGNINKIPDPELDNFQW